MTFSAQNGISTKRAFLKNTIVTLICRQKMPFLEIRDESENIMKLAQKMLFLKYAKMERRKQ